MSPHIPRDPEEKEQLREDLRKMGYEGLLDEPWGLKSWEMVQEFLRVRSNQWEETICRMPEKWTVDKWVDVYRFKKEGRPVAGQTDTWVDGKFCSPINSKDGHLMDNCIDPRQCRILEFVVLIVYSEKPRQVTKVVGNTIFGSLSGEYIVNWGQMIQEVIHHLVSHLEKGKPTPISPYLFHLYSRNMCLQEEEIDEIEAARKYLEASITSEEEEDKEGDEESEQQSPSPPDLFKGAETSSSGSMKSTYKPPEGSPRMRIPEWRSITMYEGDPFRRTFEELEQACYHYLNLHTITSRVSKLLDDCKFGNIERELKKLQSTDTKALESEVADLKLKILLKNDEVEELSKRLKCFELLQQAIGTPGNVVNKARLFDENIRVEGEISAKKVIKVLVIFTRNMETTLAGMRKLVTGSTTGEPSRPSIPPPTETPHR